MMTEAERQQFQCCNRGCREGCLGVSPASSHPLAPLVAPNIAVGEIHKRAGIYSCPQPAGLTGMCAKVGVPPSLDTRGQGHAGRGRCRGAWAAGREVNKFHSAIGPQNASLFPLPARGAAGERWLIFLKLIRPLLPAGPYT